MSDDLTKKLPMNDSEKVSLILTTLQAMEERLTGLEQKIEEILHDTLETNHTLRKHQLDALPGISYTAKRLDYSARGGESIAAHCPRRTFER